MRKFDHDVRPPRLAGNDGTLEAQRIDQKLEIVGHGCHVESVVGFGAVTMAALVDGNHGVSHLGELTRDAVPQPRIRGKAVHEDEWNRAQLRCFAPMDAVQVEIVAHGDPFVARFDHPVSFARSPMNGTMEAR